MNMSVVFWMLLAAVPAFADSPPPPSVDRLDPKTVLALRDELPPAPELGASGPSSAERPSDRRVSPRSGRFSVAPDWQKTQGVLCTTSDRDFHEFRYAERIPYCRRNVSKEDKQEVSKHYGVPWEEHSKYQYDHLLSLCLGGSNDLRNIWPMIYDQARSKAGMEADLCRRLSRGDLTQKAAVAEELGWFAEYAPHLLDKVLGQLKADPS